MVGGAICEPVVPSSIRNQVEQERGSKAVVAALHGLCISSWLQGPALSVYLS